MNYIKGRCRTNLDDYVCTINKFTAVPRIGERVEVRKKGQITSLRVVSVTHSEFNGEPIIIVELNN